MPGLVELHQKVLVFQAVAQRQSYHAVGKDAQGVVDRGVGEEHDVLFANGYDAVRQSVQENGQVVHNFKASAILQATCSGCQPSSE